MVSTKIKTKIKYYLDKFTEASGIDLRYVARGGSWSVVDLIVGNGSSLLMAMAFTRLLPKEVYGTYSYVLSYAGIFSTFAISGIAGAITRSIARGLEGDLQVAIRHRIRWGLISSALALGFSVYYFWAGNNTLALSFSIVAVFMPFYLASSSIGSYFFAKEMFRQNSIIGIVVKFGSLVTMIGTMLLTKQVPFIVLAYFIPDTIINFSFFWWAVKKYQKNRNVSDDIQKFAVHLTAMNIIGGISKRFDSILLFHSIGAVELAIYRFAQIPYERIQNALGITVGVGVPRFAKRDYKEIYKYLDKKLLWFNAIFAAVGLTAFFALPLAFRILFPQYMESVHYGRILLLPLVFGCPAIIHAIWLAKAEIKKLYVLKIITHVTRIGAFAVFIPLYGIAGAVWSSVGIAFVAGFYLFSRYLRHKAKLLKSDEAEEDVIVSNRSE